MALVKTYHCSVNGHQAVFSTLAFTPRQLSVPTAQVSLFQWAVVKTETHAWLMYREYVKSLALNVTSISYCSPQGLENIKEEKEEVWWEGGFHECPGHTKALCSGAHSSCGCLCKTFPGPSQSKFQCRSRRDSQGFTHS